MSILDSIKDTYNSCRETITGETDITCPKCRKSKLYMMNAIMHTAYCPECHFNLDDEIRKNGGGGSGAPSSGMLHY